MKIVIKIPEEIYNLVKSWTYPTDTAHRMLFELVTNGTPLDKMRAEIAEEQNDCMVKEQFDTAYGLELALWIIDKYKGESEDAKNERK